ncbi:MAG: phosphatidate cytidylyltransferase [Rhizomicrobium sp.]
MTGADDSISESSPAGAADLSAEAAKRRRDWIARPVFGVLLAALALAALFIGTWSVAALAALASALAVREWHKIVSGHPSRVTGFSIAAIVFALADFLFYGRIWPAALVLSVAVIAIAAFQAARRNHPLWHAAGTLYLGIPALALVALRGLPHGSWLILCLFLMVWATDTGALVAGNLIGGAKLAPKISPNKTWAGFFGGVAAAAIVAVVIALIVGGRVGLAAALGAGLAVAAHVGDLFESAFKRRFHVKDSSDLIPGHGGVLDRIDSTLAAVAVLAVTIFVFHLNLDSLLGVHP